MGRPKLIFTESQVLEAIKGSAGIISTVSRKLGCGWERAREAIGQTDSTKEEYANECEIILDMAESKLFEAVNNGDTQMIKYILSTKGRKRGYNEKLELEHSGNVTIVDDIK